MDLPERDRETKKEREKGKKQPPQWGAVTIPSASPFCPDLGHTRTCTPCVSRAARSGVGTTQLAMRDPIL